MYIGQNLDTDVASPYLLIIYVQLCPNYCKCVTIKSFILRRADSKEAWVVIYLKVLLLIFVILLVVFVVTIFFDILVISGALGEKKMCGIDQRKQPSNWDNVCVQEVLKDETTYSTISQKLSLLFPRSRMNSQA